MSREYQNDLQLDLFNKAESIIDTLPDFAEKFFESLRNQGMSERTVIQYAFDMKGFFEWLEPALSSNGINIKTARSKEVLENITIDDVNEYMRSVRTVKAKDKNGNGSKKLSSAAYKARKASSLRSFFKYFYKIGEISNGLGDLIEVPKIPEHEIKILDKGDVERILEAIQDDKGLSEIELARHKKVEKRDLAIITLFLGTGIRVSELVGLDLKDFDFRNASFIVTRKGGDEDEVYFSQEVENSLKDYYDNCRDSLLKKGSDEPAFFVSNRGERLTVSSVEKLVKKYAEKAGININMSPHKLRKSYGTWLYNETGDIYLVASALHHSSVETTKKHYAKMSKDHKRIAAQVSSGLFKKEN